MKHLKLKAAVLTTTALPHDSTPRNNLAAPAGVAVHHSTFGEATDAIAATAPRVYRMSELATKPKRRGLLPVSAATIWRWVKAGTFPAPFKLGRQTTVWDAAEVDAFIKKCATEAA